MIYVRLDSLTFWVWNCLLKKVNLVRNLTRERIKYLYRYDNNLLQCSTTVIGEIWKGRVRECV